MSSKVQGASTGSVPAARRASLAAGCRPRAAPRRIAGLLALAPLIVVEDLSATRIAKARTAYVENDLRERQAKYHDDSPHRGQPETVIAAVHGLVAAVSS